MKTFMISGFFPLSLGCALLLMYHFDHSVFSLFAAGFELGMAATMLIDFFQLRHARASRCDKQIEVVVDAATFDSLSELASEWDVSLPLFCSYCLQAVDPDEFREAADRLMNEWLDGSLEVSGDGC